MLGFLRMVCAAMAIAGPLAVPGAGASGADLKVHWQRTERGLRLSWTSESITPGPFVHYDFEIQYATNLAAWAGIGLVPGGFSDSPAGERSVLVSLAGHAGFVRLAYRLNMPEANLSGLDFRGADLRGAWLAGANLSNARLDDAILAGADLRGANLSGASLAGANLEGALLDDVIMDGAPAELHEGVGGGSSVDGDARHPNASVQQHVDGVAERVEDVRQQVRPAVADENRHGGDRQQ